MAWPVEIFTVSAADPVGGRAFALVIGVHAEGVDSLLKWFDTEAQASSGIDSIVAELQAAGVALYDRCDN